jgi:hypothetical protein
MDLRNLRVHLSPPRYLRTYSLHGWSFMEPLSTFLDTLDTLFSSWIYLYNFGDTYVILDTLM